MSYIWGQDLMSVLRGLQNVACATATLQEAQWKEIWNNSSLKTLTEEFTSNKGNDTFQAVTPTNGQVSLPNAFQETLEKSSMVVEGVRGYIKYAGFNLPPENSTTGGIPFCKFSNDTFQGTRQMKNLKNAVTTEENFKDIEQKPSLSNIQRVQEYSQESLTDKTCDKITLIENEVQNINMKDLRKPLSQFVPLMNDTSNVKPPLEKLIGQSWTKTRPSLSVMAKQRKVPASRIGRMMSFGSLAAGLGVGTVVEFTRRSLGHNEELPSVGSALDSAFLSQANAERIVNTLCKVRGAALKIGQILSIQDNTIISPSLQKVFERVRQSADFMPEWQVEKVLQSEFGTNWREKLTSFQTKPFAAASIGQVHLAVLANNQEVAMKIQYPGVAKGIVSDIDNLVGIMKVWNIFPEGFFIDNLVKVAKHELAWEVDYKREAECTKKFKTLLRPYPEYLVPQVVDELSTQQVLTSEFIDGIPIEQCVDLDQDTRHYIGKLIMQLCLRELFQFRYMQTDPNWANFLYNPDTQQLALLDFGASRSYEKDFMNVYIEVIKGAADGDREKVLRLSRDLGFLTGYESKMMEEAHVDTVMILGEVFQSSKLPFNFGAQNTTQRIQKLLPTMVKHRLCPPPEEIYSLHRKLSGVFLLCAKLRIQMECRSLLEEVYHTYTRS